MKVISCRRVVSTVRTQLTDYNNWSNICSGLIKLHLEWTVTYLINSNTNYKLFIQYLISPGVENILLS